MRTTLFVCGLVLACSALSECRSVDKIVGGEEASPHEFPYQVSLRRKSDNFHFCGGSVLSPHYVVSAAHCTIIWDSASEVQVVAGDHCQSKDDGTEQTVDVVSLTVHENYGSPKSFENDIAVWKLAEPLVFNEAVSAIALPSKIEDPVEDMTVTGWGTTSAGGSTPDCLMKVDVPFVTDARCGQEYPFAIADSMICAGVHGKDSCQGDSGGPLTGYKNGDRYLTGIVSWGRGCAGWFSPGVYTEVSYFVDWLAAHTIEPTVAPTTMKPTTAPPTTIKPTTAKPTTIKPTTAPPTTSKPTTAKPTTMKPTTMKPTTMKPTTIKPTTAMPTTMKPTTMEPTTMKSTTAKPTTMKPTTAPPTTIKPTTTKPTTIKPTTAPPTTSKPTTAPPTTIKPTTTKPTTIKPTTAPPTTSKPTTAKPTTMKPTTMKPTTMKPTTIKPTTVMPTTMKPTTMEPTTMKSTTVKPTTMKPTTAHPTTMKPTTAKPTTIAPTTMKPTTYPPTSERPANNTTTVPSSEPCNFVGANPIPGEGCVKDFYCCFRQNGDWSHKTCTCNEGTLFDPDDYFCNKNCDVMQYLGFTRGDHICEDGETCHT